MFVPKSYFCNMLPIKHILMLTLSAISFSLFAQDYGKAVDPKTSFNDKLEKSSKTVNSLKCNFTQVKHAAMLANDIRGNGIFCYKQRGYIRMDFDSPKGNQLIISNGMFKSVSAGKTTILKSSQNPALGQINDMITACMTGNISLLSNGARMEYFESDNYYTVVVNPLNKRTLRYVKQIVLQFEKSDMTMHTMRMVERNDDYTVYTYTDKQLNVEIADSLFIIE